MPEHDRDRIRTNDKLVILDDVLIAEAVSRKAAGFLATALKRALPPCFKPPRDWTDE